MICLSIERLFIKIILFLQLFHFINVKNINLICLYILNNNRLKDVLGNTFKDVDKVEYTLQWSNMPFISSIGVEFNILCDTIVNNEDIRQPISIWKRKFIALLALSVVAFFLYYWISVLRQPASSSIIWLCIVQRTWG